MGSISRPQSTNVNRRGVEFSLRQVEPDLWKWQFQIGDTITTGTTRSRLMGIAAHRAQKRIDAELKSRELAQTASMQAPPPRDRHGGLDQVQMIGQDQPPRSIG